MNDSFNSLKEIKKEMIKQLDDNKKPLSKEEVLVAKEAKMKDEFIAYTKNQDIKKI